MVVTGVAAGFASGNVPPNVGSNTDSPNGPDGSEDGVPVGIWPTKPESGVADFSNALLPVKKLGIDAAVKSPLAIKASRIIVLAYWLWLAAF